MEEFKCEECERSFSVEKALVQHKQHKHKVKEMKGTAVQSGSSNKKFIAAIGITLAVFFGFAFFVFPALSNQQAVQLNSSTGMSPHSANSSNVRVGINLGEKAPNFAVSTTDGEIIRLSDFSKEGKPVVIEFMATWCPNCSRDFAEVKNIYPEYADEIGFLAISLDQRETASMLKEYKNKNSYPLTFAPGSQQILRQYAVNYTTTKYAIDKDGIIRFKSTGSQGADSWRTLFNSLIA